MKRTYTTTVFQEEGMNATGISVPADIIEAFGQGKKPKVKVTVNGYTYRSTVAVYGGEFMLPLAQEHRNAARVKAREEIEVTLELDTEPRTVDVPEDLAGALAAEPGAREAFDAASYSVRKEFVRQVQDAKAEETRQQRIAGIVAKLTAK